MIYLCYKLSKMTIDELQVNYRISIMTMVKIYRIIAVLL